MMRYGLAYFPADTALQPVPFGRAAEAAGFESIWFAEHSHIPVSRRTPWGGRKDAPPLPEYYWRTHDSIVALAAIAAVTDKIRLGTGISLLAQRDAIWTAKEIASLDVISGGRAIFGIGYGWNVEEMESHGADAARRRAVVREKLLAIKEIWTNDVAAYAGEHVAFEPMWSWPKPVQQPHPPVVIGGSASPVTFRHVVEFADGWMPIYGRLPIADALTRLRQGAAAAGRDPASIEATVYMAPARPEVVEELRSAGVDRMLFGVDSVPSPEAEEQIGQLGEFAAASG